MNAILGDPDRIEAVAKDFVEHYEKRVAEGATQMGKAIFVSSSRLIVYDLYKAIIRLRPEWAEKRMIIKEMELNEQEQKEKKSHFQIWG